MQNLKIGQRVSTKLGDGEVLGFEIFFDNGRKSAISYSSFPEGQVDTRRILVKLDNPSNWILSSEKQLHPYMMYLDIKE